MRHKMCHDFRWLSAIENVSHAGITLLGWLFQHPDSAHHRANAGDAVGLFGLRSFVRRCRLSRFGIGAKCFQDRRAGIIQLRLQDVDEVVHPLGYDLIHVHIVQVGPAVGRVPVRHDSGTSSRASLRSLAPLLPPR